MKSPQMEKVLDEFTKSIFGNKRSDKYCVACKSDKIKREDFRDEVSWEEFGISRMCQVCQDKVFGK